MRSASACGRPSTSRALFDPFGIEVLATTDAATDSLEHHRAIRESGWTGRVIPTFRPDALFQIASNGWRDAMAALEAAVGGPVRDYARFIDAIEERRVFFRCHYAPSARAPRGLRSE
jgi:glucuronate isomerase